VFLANKATKKAQYKLLSHSNPMISGTHLSKWCVNKFYASHPHSWENAAGTGKC